MRILVVASEYDFRRIANAAPSRDACQLASVAEAMRTLATDEHCALVLDAIEVRNGMFSSIVAAVRRSSAELYVLSCDHNFVISRVLDALEFCDAEFIVKNANTPNLLWQRLSRTASASVPSMTCRRLASNLRMLDSRVRSRTVSLFGWATIPASVVAFVADCALSASTGESCFARAGLRGMKSTLAIAALARSWHALEAKSGSGRQLRTMDDVAANCGFKSLRTFEDAYQRVVGLTPRAAIDNLCLDDFCEKLCSFVRR